MGHNAMHADHDPPQDNPMEPEPLTRCVSNFTLRTGKHLVLVCFGVDPCGTAKNTVEGSGVVEHCKESTNDIVVKKDMVLERRRTDLLEFF